MSCGRELMRTIGDSLARNAPAPAEVDPACTLNQDRQLTMSFTACNCARAHADKASECGGPGMPGNEEGHARFLRALTSSER